MDFIEEKTPAGYSLKILLKKWNFMAFDRKGKPVYADQESGNLLHPVPLFIFAGEKFDLKRTYDRQYHLLKVRNGSIVLPYERRVDHAVSYVFIPTEVKLDMIPVRLMLVRNVVQMVREIDISYRPDYIIADEGIGANDVIIMSNRYKAQNILYAMDEGRKPSVDDDLDRFDNLNMLSRNPVFLARIHLRSMELSKVNQLLLDFDFTELETEYVAASIREAMKREDTSNRDVERLRNLMESFTFYLYLLQRNGEKIRAFLDRVRDERTMISLRTLLSKAKSNFPGRDDQLLFTDYENMIMDKLEELKTAAKT